MLKFIRWVNERGGNAIIPEFKKPPVKYKGVNEIFAEVLKHEQFITASINEVLEVAIAEKDHATVNWNSGSSANS
jgi:ferritin